MSTLHAFLHPASAEDILEVEVSKRFRDENGKAVPFKIRAVTQEENDLLVKRSMRPVKGGRRGEGAGRQPPQPPDCGCRHGGAGLHQRGAVPGLRRSGPSGGPWKDAAGRGIQEAERRDYAAERL